MIHASPGLISTFVTLLATIGPIETAAMFLSVTQGAHRQERRDLSARSMLIAGLLLFLALGGGSALTYLNISIPAFQIAGGLLLLLQALTLTFSSPGLSSIGEQERLDAEGPGDIAVFPLAFPIIASAGTLAAIVLMMGRTEGWIERSPIIAMLFASLFLTHLAMSISDLLALWLGRTGSNVVGRVSGVLLAGLAVQLQWTELKTSSAT